MTNPNDIAFTDKTWSGEDFDSDSILVHRGLTKREHFAIMIMPSLMKTVNPGKNAVLWADNLIEALNEEIQ